MGVYLIAATHSSGKLVQFVLHTSDVHISMLRAAAGHSSAADAGHLPASSCGQPAEVMTVCKLHRSHEANKTPWHHTAVAEGHKDSEHLSAVAAMASAFRFDSAMLAKQGSLNPKN